MQVWGRGGEGAYGRGGGARSSLWTCMRGMWCRSSRMQVRGRGGEGEDGRGGGARSSLWTCMRGMSCRSSRMQVCVYVVGRGRGRARRQSRGWARGIGCRAGFTAVTSPCCLCMPHPACLMLTLPSPPLPPPLHAGPALQATDFEWVSRLRYYWRDDVYVDMVQVSRVGLPMHDGCAGQ